MKTKTTLPLAVLLSICSVAIIAAEEEGFVPMFNGKDLTGWVNANCAPDTWTVKDGAICCTGIPTGALRTERQYENFILEAEWRHLSKGGNSGIFLWGTPISAPGVPFLKGIEVQVLENDYPAKGKNEWYTTHGDVFPIHGATMKPIGKSKGMRNFPSEERSKPSPEWNHYRIVANNGSIRLSVNGKEVSGGDECNYRKGYLALESEGAPVEFKNVRIKELPSSNPAAEVTAPVDEGFRPLYTGVDLKNWKDPEAAAKRWKPSDWKLSRNLKTDGTVDLLTEKEYGDAEFIVDVHYVSEGELQPGVAVILRGKKGMRLALAAAGSSGKWNRYKIQTKGKDVTVWLNGKEIHKTKFIDEAPAQGPFGLADGNGDVDFASIYVRELK